MKMTKRIFIALLILAVSVSSLAVFASAEETETWDYANVLEYFEEQSLIDYDFSGDDVDYSASLNVNRPAGRANQFTEKFVSDSDAPGGKYFSISINERNGRVGAYVDNHAYFGWTSDEAIDDFNIDMTVSGAKFNSKDTESDDKFPKIIIVVGSETFGTMAQANLPKSGITLVAIDFRGGYFTYLKGGKDYKTSYQINGEAWYNVSLTYDVDNGMSITIYDVANPENALTVTDGDIPLTSIKDIRIGAHGDDNGNARGTEMRFADVRLLGGVYHREISNMQADVEKNILAMYDLFIVEETPIEEKIAMCEIVKKIVGYGFTSEDESVNAALAQLSVGAVGLYNSKISEFNSSVSSLTSFAEKKAYAEKVQTYVDAIGEMDLSDYSSDIIASIDENVAEFNKIAKALEDAEASSIRFIEIAESVKGHDLTDYAVVVEDLKLFDGCEPDVTYEGIADAYKTYTKVVDAEESIRESAELFISAVNTANDTSLDFNTRAVAYNSIEKLYFDNETYPGVTEAIAIYVDVLGPYMSLEISNAENFVKYVNRADYALYISAKQENLDIAETYMDICQPHFAGVKEAKELYAQIRAYIAEQRAHAQAYIDAVNALDSLSGAALLAGVDNALALQEAGNVLGVDGVTEANIKLNKTIASIELGERYSIHFISLVASLDGAKDSIEKFSILTQALSAELDAQNDYAGVAEASAKLAQAVSEYNAQAEAINAEFDKANDVAANTCGIASTDNTVFGHVIALIKKFFDEE